MGHQKKEPLPPRGFNTCVVLLADDQPEQVLGKAGLWLPGGAPPLPHAYHRTANLVTNASRLGPLAIAPNLPHCAPISTVGFSYDGPLCRFLRLHLLNLGHHHAEVVRG